MISIAVEINQTWSEVYKNAIFTEKGYYPIIDKIPSDKWVKQILLAEHSPIRIMQINIELRGIPSFVQNHLVRHKFGVEFFVHSSRPDRGAVPREQQKKTDPVDMRIVCNPQSLINISRKRLCNKAEDTTLMIWKNVVEEIRNKDKILASVLVPECVYRGFCPERKSCGYINTPRGEKALSIYR